MKKKLTWILGLQMEACSVGVFYWGKALKPKQRYFWKVEIWDECGRRHSSTECAWFETGLQGKTEEAVYSQELVSGRYEFIME